MTDKIRVIISNSQKEVKIPTGLRMLVRRCCNAVLRMENFQGAAEVSVTFANNEQIHELNKMHRNVDAPTDVLSFPMGEDGKYDIDPATNAKILGDIVISKEKVISQAEEYGHSEKREYAFLIAHSMLHLMGYDHMEDEERICMEAKQKDILNRLNIIR